MQIRTNKGTLETNDGTTATLEGVPIALGAIRHMKRPVDGWACMAMVGKACVMLGEADACALLKLRAAAMPDGPERLTAIGDLMVFDAEEGRREDEADVRDAAKRHGHPSVAAWTQARGGTA